MENQFMFRSQTPFKSAATFSPRNIRSAIASFLAMNAMPLPSAAGAKRVTNVSLAPIRAKNAAETACKDGSSTTQKSVLALSNPAGWPTWIPRLLTWSTPILLVLNISAARPPKKKCKNHTLSCSVPKPTPNYTTRVESSPNHKSKPPTSPRCMKISLWAAPLKFPSTIWTPMRDWIESPKRRSSMALTNKALENDHFYQYFATKYSIYLLLLK